jgi:hypothetical protein
MEIYCQKNGLYAYGTPVWGNLARITIRSITFLSLRKCFLTLWKPFFEGGLRYDNGKVTGSLLVELQQNLMNNDGVLSAPENNVYAIDNANATC